MMCRGFGPEGGGAIAEMGTQDLHSTSVLVLALVPPITVLCPE